MVAPICLSARTFLNDLPADLRSGWYGFLDRNPEIEAVLEARHMPILETMLAEMEVSTGDPLLEHTVLKEGFFLVPLLLALMGGGGAYAGYSAYKGVDSMVKQATDSVTDMAVQAAEKMGLPADSYLVNIVKKMGGMVKDMGVPLTVVTGLMKAFGVDWTTVGGLVTGVIVLYALYQLVKSKGPDTAEKVADAAAKNGSAAQKMGDKIEQNVPNAAAPKAQASKALGVEPAAAGGQQTAQAGAPAQAAAPTPPTRDPVPPTREAVYRNAEKYLGEKYNMSLLELHRHLVEAHGPAEGTRRFRTVSRIAMAKALGR